MTVKQEACVRTSTGTNFTAIHTGALAQLDSYKLEVPALKRTVRGKLFIKELLGLTGMEISMNKLPAGVSVPFYHQHRENEETYIFLQGSGQMQVDGETIDVEEGAIVRISPKGSRCIRNNSQGDLYFLCIQAKEHSLNAATIEDGVKNDQPVSWPN